MISKITDFKCVSGVSSPLLPLVYSSFCYPQNECDGAFLQTDTNGCINSVFSLSNNSAVLIRLSDGDFNELCSFFNFFKVKYITSREPVDIFCSSADKCPLMTFNGELQGVCDCKSLTLSSTAEDYKSVHNLVSEIGNAFADWYPVFSKKINTCDAFATFFEAESKAVSAAAAPFVYGDCAVISGVATHNDFREKGFASACVRALVSTLITKEKNEIFLWCKESVSPFYKRLGFKICGNIYIGECKR